MPFLKEVPEIARVRGKWCIPAFQPGPAAFDWPRYKGRTGTVYVVECAGFYKIGLATNFQKRFRELDFGVPLPLVRIATRTVPLAGLPYAEAWLHEQYKDRRIKGEWFAITRAEACRLLEKALVRARLYEEASAAYWFDDERRARDAKRAADYLAKHPEIAERVFASRSQ